MQPIHSSLLEWFRKNKRDLPWRKTKDPYRIWVSEIMLQQTRVETVIEYYLRFMDRFPTIRELAEADEEKVLLYWQGLGYYSRARNLHKGAKLIWEKHGGAFPQQMEEVRKIPGIGAYTAGAILSIAFNQPHPAVDGNVLRVFSRVFLVEEDIASKDTVKKIEKLVRQHIPRGEAGEFTEALMELGALICVPGVPRCLLCPLFHLCEARKSARQEQLPVKSKKIGPRLMRMVFCVIHHQNRILITKNPSSGLLGGLWGWPGKENASGAPEEDRKTAEDLVRGLSIPVSHMRQAGRAKHVFTHMDWEMIIFECHGDAMTAIEQEHRWILVDELPLHPFPKVFQKVTQAAGLAAESQDC